MNTKTKKILTESRSDIWDDANELADQMRAHLATEWPLINDNHHIEIDQETNPDGKVIVVIYFDGNKVCSASGNNIDGWKMALARTRNWQKYDSFDLLMNDMVDEFSLYGLGNENTETMPLGESISNNCRKKYTAFMESVCNKFNCPDALPALKEGFKAFCEATASDFYDTHSRKHPRLEGTDTNGNSDEPIDITDGYTTPTYKVTIASDYLDPHPFTCLAGGRSEYDAIYSAGEYMLEHHIHGVQTEEPEYPEDYVDIGNGWIPSWLIHIEPLD